MAQLPKSLFIFMFVLIGLVGEAWGDEPSARLITNGVMTCDSPSKPMRSTDGYSYYCVTSAQLPSDGCSSGFVSGYGQSSPGQYQCAPASQVSGAGSGNGDPDYVHPRAQPCKDALDSALTGCDLQSNSDIKTAFSVANVFKNQMDNMATSNLQAACSGMGNVSKTMNLALGVYQGICAARQGVCSQSCSEAVSEMQRLQTASGGPLVATPDDVRAVRRMKTRCDDLQQNIAGAADSMMRFMAVDQAMQQCSLLTAANKTWQQKCQENPNDPMCKLMQGADCNNPQVAATNKVCRCQKTPNAPECLTGTGGAVGNNNTNPRQDAGADGAGNANGNFGGLGGGNGMYGMGPDGQPPKDQEAGGSLSRGGTGRSSVSESGGTGSAPQRGGGGGGSNLNAKVIGGYGFGAGAAGGGGGGGSGSGGGYGGAYGTQAPQNGQNVDLRQFLPGGQRDPSRGLAGISGPDGITGPNSDIWKKVKSRYFAVSPSLLP